MVISVRFLGVHQSQPNGIGCFPSSHHLGGDFDHVKKMGPVKRGPNKNTGGGSQKGRNGGRKNTGGGGGSLLFRMIPGLWNVGTCVCSMFALKKGCPGLPSCQVAAFFSVTVAGFWGKLNGQKRATGDPGCLRWFNGGTSRAKTCFWYEPRFWRFQMIRVKVDGEAHSNSLCELDVFNFLRSLILILRSSDFFGQSRQMKTPT